MGTLLTSVLTYVLTFVMEQFRISLKKKKKNSSMKALKNDEIWSLFHLKSSFCSQNIYIFVLNFWSCRKTT